MYMYVHVCMAYLRSFLGVPVSETALDGPPHRGRTEPIHVCMYACMYVKM